MRSQYTRLTLIAERGKNELVVTLRQRGHQQTLLFNGQLVCSRTRASDELVLGPAARSFDPASLREAVDQLAGSIGHSIPEDHDKPATHPGLEEQQRLLETGPTVRLVAHRCERCASSMIYEQAGEGPAPLCPACQLKDMTTITASAALALSLIHSELAKQLSDARGHIPRRTAEDIKQGLGRLGAVRDRLHSYDPAHGDLKRNDG